ncbi:MAG: DUF58 domain-containing protein [Cytophagales bacterium]|nr:DUF58 domain-containing protein [Armatimonadota bacterium]
MAHRMGGEAGGDSSDVSSAAAAVPSGITVPAPPSRLLDADFLKKLERLSVTSKRPFPGRMKGEKRSTKRGTSIEFADYREYAVGDDLRYVDWKAYARLERLFLKLFVEEEDLSIHLLLDASQSMGYASAPGHLTKFDYARKIAAALGYVGLVRYDRVGVSAFGHSLGRRVPTLRSRASVPTLFQYLEQIAPGGTTNFAHALQNYAQRTSSAPGVCVVLSDFLDPNWEKGIRALLARRFQVVLLQILDPEEVEPTFLGDLRLVDAETGESREVSVTPQVLARYRNALDSFCGQLSETANRHGMDYLRTTTDAPFEDLLLKTLRGSGLLR